MKHEKPINPNYCAIVTIIDKLHDIDNCDNVIHAEIFGNLIIVTKNTKLNDIGIFFPVECKLSHEFLKQNNLYRHSEQNIDNTKVGYFEDNGRIRCMKFRGNRSEGLFMPLDCLTFTNIDTSKLQEKDCFDVLNGSSICTKYEIVTKECTSNNPIKRNTCKMFIEHFDTKHFMRELNSLPSNTLCYIEEKIHGTSHRTGYMKYDSVFKPTFLQKIRAIFKPDVKNNYIHLNGTRRVIHDPNKTYNSFHDNTMREEVLEKVSGKLNKGEQLYMELFGYEKNGKHIQKGFPYNCKPNDTTSYRTLLYRVTMNNEDGERVDYNREYVYNKAKLLGLEVPHLFEKYYYDGSEQSLEILKEKVQTYAHGQSESGTDTLKEGVVIWFIDVKGEWKALKHKSPEFILRETQQLDELNKKNDKRTNRTISGRHGKNE